MKCRFLYKLADHGKTLAKCVENWYDEARSLLEAKDEPLVSIGGFLMGTFSVEKFSISLLHNIHFIHCEEGLAL